VLVTRVFEVRLILVEDGLALVVVATVVFEVGSMLVEDGLALVVVARVVVVAPLVEQELPAQIS